MPTAVSPTIEVKDSPLKNGTKPIGAMEQSTLIRRGVGLRGVDNNLVSPGYTLVAHLTSPGTVRLIANDGTEAHRWNLPYRPGRHARILPNGNLAYNGVHPNSPRLFPLWQKYRGGVMMQVDPAGNVVSEHRDPMAHHDQHHLDDGSILYTTLSALTPEQAASIPGGIPDSEAPDGKAYGDCIKHVSPTGSLLWSWKAIEHLPPNLFPLQSHYAREHWPLINSVFPLKDGNILASLRSVSAVIIISRETGEVIWHLDSTVAAQQHCASELSNGNILIFDNGTFRHRESATYSRVIEVSRQDKSIVWEYKDPHPMTFFTPFMGGAQRLKGGNTLITEAAFGRVFEVTAEGKMVWEWVNEEFADYKGLDAKEIEGYFDYPANALFRAYKYTPEEIPWLQAK
jgi:Arylsulfotransferase (ASST)